MRVMDEFSHVKQSHDSWQNQYFELHREIRSVHYTSAMNNYYKATYLA